MQYNRKRMDPDTKILKFPAGTAGPNSASEQENPMPTQMQTQAALATPPPAAEPPPPVWMQRFFLVTMVIVCLWIGMVLAVLPWLPAWTENSLVADSPNLDRKSTRL